MHLSLGSGRLCYDFPYNMAMRYAALFLFGLLAATHAGAAAGPQDFLPPPPAWHGASESLIVPPDHPWITPSEKTGLTDTPSYDETIAWLKKLSAASKTITLHEFGRTAQGRTLYAVLASTTTQRTPEGLRATRKPTLLAQAGIHAGEIDGKDACLMLLRDLAFGAKASLLERANLLFIPALNADGHERISEWNRPNQRGPIHMGWRTTAQNLNLNRDYMKADAPEMRGLLGLLAAWQPSLYLDLHVTDGLDYQYDVTYSYHGDSVSHSPRIAQWLDGSFNTTVSAALKAQGHIPLNIYINPADDTDLAKGLSSGHGPPRFSHAYGDLRHLPSVLVETHSLKPYRQRVLGTYILVAAALDALSRDGAALQAAIAADEAARRPEVTLTWVDGGPPRKLDFLGVEFESYLSPASGVKEVRWTGKPKLYPNLPILTNKPGILARRPVAYWVPASKPDVIDRLLLHGVRVEPQSAARTLDLEMYRLVSPASATGGLPFEGRNMIKTDVKAEKHRETFPAGSVRVPTDQPLGDLAIALLEPLGADSLLAWGFFEEIRQRTEYIEGYVIAPMADKMLADDPKLKAEFEAKLKSEEKFAKDSNTRLQWFYARTKFYDDRYLLYPVGIER